MEYLDYFELLNNKFWSSIEQVPSLFIHWLNENFGSGHRPLFLYTEKPVSPRGFWWSYKVPVYYYSSNTAFYSWTHALDFWVQFLRKSSLIGHAPVWSYKQVNALLLEQTPYWCSFAGWDVFSSLLAGDVQFLKVFRAVGRVTLFENTPFEIRLVYHPYFFDNTWDEWFLKTDYMFIEGVERAGVSPWQIKRRIFLKGFFVGYWAYLLYITPWPWRILYPKDRSNWYWYTRVFRWFFKTSNKWNRFLFGLTCFLIWKLSSYSLVFDEIVIESPLLEFWEDFFGLWMDFLCFSVLIYLFIGRVSRKVFDFMRGKDLAAYAVADVLANGSPLRRKLLVRRFINLAHPFYLFLALLWGYLLLIPFVVTLRWLSILPFEFIYAFILTYILEPIFAVLRLICLSDWVDVEYFWWWKFRAILVSFYWQSLYYIYFVFYLILYSLAIFWPFLVVVYKMVGIPYLNTHYPLLFHAEGFTLKDKLVYVFRVSTGLYKHKGGPFGV